MQLGMVGFGRMGANMVRRLARDGHRCVVFDRSPEAVKAVVDESVIGTTDSGAVRCRIEQAAGGLGHVAGGRNHRGHDQEVGRASRCGDTIIDGGNAFYRDDIRRANP